MTRKKSDKRTLGERIGRWPLFGKIVAWVVPAILAFGGIMCWLWHLTSDPGKSAASIAATSLTIVGSVGAVAYLVIKYQERRQAERDEERTGREEEREEDRHINAKMQQAVDQLGSDKASTRIAGVYALADVADTYRGGYRQRVVDILCGYMRSDRETYPLGADGKPVMDRPRSGDADKAVESTIISVMRDHLYKERRRRQEIGVQQIVDDGQLWCDCAFDLHGATFHEDVNLNDTTFERDLNFQGTKFKGSTDFNNATFKDYAHFSNATLKSADFFMAAFEGPADFCGTTFEKLTNSVGAANFDYATFKSYAGFNGATFKSHAGFNGATFKDYAHFSDTNFEGLVKFNEATFEGDKHFGRAIFESAANFRGADIGESSPVFEGCICNRRFRGTDSYEWGPIPIPEDNDGLPAGAKWDDSTEEDDKDDNTMKASR